MRLRLALLLGATLGGVACAAPPREFTTYEVAELELTTDLAIATSPGAAAPADDAGTASDASAGDDDPSAVLAQGSLSGLTFATGTSFLRPSVVVELRELERVAKAHPTTRISIFGHADAVGDASFNKRLSERRKSQGAAPRRLPAAQAQQTEARLLPPVRPRWCRLRAVDGGDPARSA